jgi:hypothetical protein
VASGILPDWPANWLFPPVQRIKGAFPVAGALVIPPLLDKFDHYNGPQFSDHAIS